MRSPTVVVFALGTLCVPCFAGVSLNTPGTANIWLAGMPDGSGAAFDDTAPFESPTLVPLSLSPGDILTFSATGGVSNIGEPPVYGPDGSPTIFGHTVGAQNGISDILVNLNSLIGVFLNDGAPDLTAAPGAIDFTDAGLGLDFLSLAPELKQVFFIGDGATGTRAPQTFVVPDGATRLFLGVMDAHNNLNNIGSFDVTVNIPAPGGAALALLGLAVSARRRR